MSRHGALCAALVPISSTAAQLSFEMPHRLQNFPVDGIEPVDDPRLQLVVGHGLAFQERLQIKTGRRNDLVAIVAGHVALMEKNRVASGVEPPQRPLFGDMGASYPCPAGRFLPGVIPPGSEDLPVGLEQRGDELLLKSLVCHVPAGVHETVQVSLEKDHSVALIAEAFPEKEHDAAASHVIIEKTFGR